MTTAEMTRPQQNFFAGFERCRNDNHRISELGTEALAGGAVMMWKYYGPERHARLYYELRIIGPRGAIKKSINEVHA